MHRRRVCMNIELIVRYLHSSLGKPALYQPQRFAAALVLILRRAEEAQTIDDSGSLKRLSALIAALFYAAEQTYTLADAAHYLINVIKILVVGQRNINIYHKQLRQSRNFRNITVANGNNGIIDSTAQGGCFHRKADNYALNILIPHNIADCKEMVAHNMNTHYDILQHVLYRKTDDGAQQSESGDRRADVHSVELQHPEHGDGYEHKAGDAERDTHKCRMLTL